MAPQVEGLEELLLHAGPSTGKMTLDNVQVGLRWGLRHQKCRALPALSKLGEDIAGGSAGGVVCGCCCTNVRGKVQCIKGTHIHLCSLTHVQSTQTHMHTCRATSPWSTTSCCACAMGLPSPPCWVARWCCLSCGVGRTGGGRRTQVSLQARPRCMRACAGAAPAVVWAGLVVGAALR